MILWVSLSHYITSSTTQTTLIDESHPLYLQLHHEESLSAVFVSQPLIGEDYPTWARLRK